MGLISSVTSLTSSENTLESIQSYLEYGSTTDGKLIHWTLMATSSTVAHPRTLGKQTEGVLSTLGTFLSSVASIASLGVSSIVGAILDTLALPNLEGIPLYTASLTVSREIDVSEDVYIVQKDSSTQYALDNSVPHLRKWSLDGYLQSLTPKTELQTGFKTTLMLQERLIDMLSQARRPMWFKTHQNEFVQVLITQYQFQYVAENMSSTHVQLEMIEFKALELASGTLTDSSSSTLWDKVSATTGMTAALLAVTAVVAVLL